MPICFDLSVLKSVLEIPDVLDFFLQTKFYLLNVSLLSKEMSWTAIKLALLFIKLVKRNQQSSQKLNDNVTWVKFIYY